MTRPKIIITVEGGIVQDIFFPRGTAPIEIEVRDYDQDGAEDERLKTDEAGDKYLSCIWRNPA